MTSLSTTGLLTASFGPHPTHPHQHHRLSSSLDLDVHSLGSLYGGSEEEDMEAMVLEDASDFGLEMLEDALESTGSRSSLPPADPKRILDSPSVQFARFTLSSAVSSTPMTPMACKSERVDTRPLFALDIEETLAEIVDNEESIAKVALAKSLAMTAGKPRAALLTTLDPIVEEDHLLQRSSPAESSLPQSPSRKALDPIVEEDHLLQRSSPAESSLPQSPSRKAALSDVLNRCFPPLLARHQRKHWSSRAIDRDSPDLDDGFFGDPSILTSMPMPKVRRTMSDLLFSTLPSSSVPPSVLQSPTHASSIPTPLSVDGSCDKEEANVPLRVPSFSSTKDAMPRIAPHTVCELIDGRYSGLYDQLIIVDSRYPYEYAGGHIPGGVNLCGLDAAEKYLFAPDLIHAGRRILLVFHCEFSSERAPRMALHVRNLDRTINAARYPLLSYPDIFILDGGYKNFFDQCGQRCDPPHQYIPMRNARYKEELRFHQRMKQISGQKHRQKLRTFSLRAGDPKASDLLFSTTTKGTVETVGLRKSASESAYHHWLAGNHSGRERANQLTKEYYAGRQLVRHAPGEIIQEFLSSDGPEIQHGSAFTRDAANCFEAL